MSDLPSGVEPSASVPDPTLAHKPSHMDILQALVYHAGVQGAAEGVPHGHPEHDARAPTPRLLRQRLRRYLRWCTHEGKNLSILVISIIMYILALLSSAGMFLDIIPKSVDLVILLCSAAFMGISIAEGILSLGRTLGITALDAVPLPAAELDLYGVSARDVGPDNTALVVDLLKVSLVAHPGVGVALDGSKEAVPSRASMAALMAMRDQQALAYEVSVPFFEQPAGLAGGHPIPALSIDRDRARIEIQALLEHPAVANAWAEGPNLAILTEDLHMDDPRTGRIHQLGRFLVCLPAQGVDLTFHPLFAARHPYLHGKLADLAPIVGTLAELRAAGDMVGLFSTLIQYLETPDPAYPGL